MSDRIVLFFYMISPAFHRLIQAQISRCQPTYSHIYIQRRGSALVVYTTNQCCSSFATRKLIIIYGIDAVQVYRECSCIVPQSIRYCLYNALVVLQRAKSMNKLNYEFCRFDTRATFYASIYRTIVKFFQHCNEFHGE